MRKTLFLFLLFLPTFAVAETLFVQVKSSRLRATPDFLGTTVATVSFGDPLEKLSAQGAWVQVRGRGKTGYVHQTAITPRKVVLNSSARPSSITADSSDVVLAGKGFSQQVENQYAAQQGLNFRTVDEVERTRVSEKEVTSFIREGSLQRRG